MSLPGFEAAQQRVAAAVPDLLGGGAAEERSSVMPLCVASV
ncbi:hypothetical protein [Streptomyces sp. NPDC054786]